MKRFAAKAILVVAWILKGAWALLLVGMLAWGLSMMYRDKGWFAVIELILGSLMAIVALIFVLYWLMVLVEWASKNR